MFANCIGDSVFDRFVKGNGDTRLTEDVRGLRVADEPRSFEFVRDCRFERCMSLPAFPLTK